MVLKTRSDRPVQSGTGLQFGPVILHNQKLHKKHKKLGIAGSIGETENQDGLTGFKTIQLGCQNTVVFGKIEPPCL